jgi:hypothetical protein
VHESSIGHFRPGRGETGCTMLGLAKRYGLGERELNIVRALKFNESATFEVPDFVEPVQVTPPKAERAHMPASGDTSLPWEFQEHPWDGTKVLGPQQPDGHRRVIAGYLDSTPPASSSPRRTTTRSSAPCSCARGATARRTWWRGSTSSAAPELVAVTGSQPGFEQQLRRAPCT